MTITGHRFTVRRQDGIGPHPDTLPCAIPTCRRPRSEHGLPACKGELNIKGQDFSCDLIPPHDGWAHSSLAAEAIWQ